MNQCVALDRPSGTDQDPVPIPITASRQTERTARRCSQSTPLPPGSNDEYRRIGPGNIQQICEQFVVQAIARFDCAAIARTRCHRRRCVGAIPGEASANPFRSGPGHRREFPGLVFEQVRQYGMTRKAECERIRHRAQIARRDLFEPTPMTQEFLCHTVVHFLLAYPEVGEPRAHARQGN